MTRNALLLAAAALVTTAVPVTAGAAAAHPLVNGCASGHEAVDVAWATAQGYRLPAQFDDPANGGNGDGTVCGRAMGPQLTPTGLQQYLWGENNVGPS
jgi:hypothetical protein